HDFETRITKAKELLQKGFKVKFNLMFRGRELAHVEIGRKVIDQAVAALTGVGKPESTAKFEGRNLSIIIAPSKNA
ncbi:MAG: translation initiation factor IF-3 C-terminal domain-containing protein, partial [Candidatus Margulisiibacteriota bacterium]